MPCYFPASFADLERSTKEAKLFLGGALSYVDPVTNETVGCPSFWMDEMKMHAPFAKEHLRMEAQGGNPVGYGAKGVKYRCPRSVDLFYKASVAQRRPGLCGVVTNDDGSRTLLTGAAQPYYINAWGFAASPQIKLTTTEGQEICNPRSFLADYIKDSCQVESDVQIHEAHHRFELPDGSEDVEKLQAYSRNSAVINHPFGFSHADQTTKALYVCCMYLCGFAIEVDFAAKESLIQVPGGAEGVQLCVRPDGVSDAVLQARLDSRSWSPAPLQDTDLKASIEATIISLEEEERADLVSRSVDQLWQETKEIRKVIPSPTNGTAGEAYEYEIKFSEQHLIGRYTLAARTAASLRSNTPFNFSGVVDPDTGIKQPIIKAAGVHFGSSVRHELRPELYWREVAYNESGAARIPRGMHVLQIPFQIDMMDSDHTGGADHLVIEEVTIPLLLAPEVFTTESPTVELRLWLHYHRFLRYREGGVVSRFVRL